MRVRFFTIRRQQVKQHTRFHELHKTFYCQGYHHIRYIFHKLQHPFMQQFMNHFIAHSAYQIHCMVFHPMLTMISIRMPFSRTINIHSNQLKIVSLIPNRKKTFSSNIHHSLFTCILISPVQLPYYTAQAHQIHPSTSSTSLNHFAFDHAVASKVRPQSLHSTVNYYEQEYLTSQVNHFHSISNTLNICIPHYCLLTGFFFGGFFFNSDYE